VEASVGAEVVVVSVLVSLGVAALLVGGLVLLAVAWGVRRLRRLTGHLQRRVTDVRARFLPPGPRRDAAVLRQRLQAELHATRDALGAAPDGLVFRADAAAVAQELAAAAGELDRDLAAVERFLDPAEQRSALAALRPQAEEVIATTYKARQIVLRTAAEDRTRRLTTLHEDVERQWTALDIYRSMSRQPHP
jgi:signal transduction histidine kinase